MVAAAAATACGGLTSSDLTGTWISSDSASRVQFFPDGRALVSDPLNALTASGEMGEGMATIAIGDTTGAPVEIAVTKSGDSLVMVIETDTVRYTRATPPLEAAFSRMGNNEAINAMNAELALLKDAQHTVFQLTKTYSKAFPMDFKPGNSVSIQITDASATSWSAIATHPATRLKCSIAVGNSSSGNIDCR